MKPTRHTILVDNSTRYGSVASVKMKDGVAKIWVEDGVLHLRTSDPVISVEPVCANEIRVTVRKP